LRVLTLMDEFTRKCLALRVARRLNSYDLIETRADVMLIHGVPEHIRSEITAGATRAPWLRCGWLVGGFFFGQRGDTVLSALRSATHTTIVSTSTSNSRNRTLFVDWFFRNIISTLHISQYSSIRPDAIDGTMSAGPGPR
jgi:hypothetical protein